MQKIVLGPALAESNQLIPSLDGNPIVAGATRSLVTTQRHLPNSSMWLFDAVRPEVFGLAIRAAGRPTAVDISSGQKSGGILHRTSP